MKYILIFILFYGTISVAQTDTLLNKRYGLNYNANRFSTVAVTDSAYYITALGTNTNNFLNYDYVMIKIGFDGDVIDYKTYNDTLAISNFTELGTATLLKTLDGNYVQILLTVTSTDERGLLFIKSDKNGNIVQTKQINQMSIDTVFQTFYPAGIWQNEDSTYVGGVTINSKISPYQDAYVIYKLDKNANLLWYKIHWVDISYYVSFASSILKYSPNKYIIGGFKGNNSLTIPDITYHRMHPYFIVTDSLGNFLYDHTSWQDTLVFETKSLTKTSDGNLLYCGKYGNYNPIEEWEEFISYIVKFDTNFNKIWEIKSGRIGGVTGAGFNKILTLNDSQYVAVGKNSTDTVGQYGSICGYLIKFNLQGEVLWERKYVKIQGSQFNWPDHYLYDISMTRDSGFVMVGQVTNSQNFPGYLPGQKGWLVKTDKYGCIVPNCQQYDNIDTTTTTTDTTTTDTTVTDTTITPPIDSSDTLIVEPAEIFPNPATTEIYYYHLQGENTSPFTCYIYNMQGQVVQEFTVSADKVTYIIDISQLASDTYIFKVVSNTGTVVRSSKFVKV
jgi:hypothetical protein